MAREIVIIYFNKDISTIYNTSGELRNSNLMFDFTPISYM